MSKGHDLKKDVQDREVQKYLKPREAGKPKVFAVSKVSEFVEVATGLDPKQASFFSLQDNQLGNFARTQLSCSSRLAG